MKKWTGFGRKLCVYAVAAAIGGLTMGVPTSGADKAASDIDITAIMKKAFKGAGGPSGGPGGRRPGGAGAPGAGGPGGAGGAAGQKKPSMVQKAIDGTATADEVKTLLGYCQELAKAKPPKGEQKDWNERTTALTTAVEAISKGDKTAGPKLKTAANCKACHELHQDK